MYRTTEVYDALLALLCNGDVDIQKAALETILTWKDSAVTPYQENLLNLLDDARFRDELPLLLTQDKIHDENLGQVLPIMLRLLYGKVIAGKQGLAAKRKSVFIGLKNTFGDAAIHQFLSIAIGPLSNKSVVSGSTLNEDVLQMSLMNPRKQVGMLHLLDDLLTTLKNFLRAIRWGCSESINILRHQSDTRLAWR